MEQSEFLAYLLDVFERLELSYFIAGSVATSYYGEPRFTNDIDLVVEFMDADVHEFCQCFPSEQFYISTEAVRSAVANRRQFNIIHPASGLKADVFVLNKSDLEQSRFNRRERLELEAGLTAWFARPEDVILKKLVYYDEGRSEKHIRDIVGVLKVQGKLIDFDYLTDWVSQLGLIDLWTEVLVHANSENTNSDDVN